MNFSKWKDEIVTSIDSLHETVTDYIEKQEEQEEQEKEEQEVNQELEEKESEVNALNRENIEEDNQEINEENIEDDGQEFSLYEEEVITLLEENIEMQQEIKTQLGYNNTMNIEIGFMLAFVFIFSIAVKVLFNQMTKW